MVVQKADQFIMSKHRNVVFKCSILVLGNTMKVPITFGSIHDLIGERNDIGNY